MNEIQELDDKLNEKYREYIAGLMVSIKSFLDILERAFSPNIEIAFNGSVDLARKMGVPENEILNSREKVAAYFLDS